MRYPTFAALAAACLALISTPAEARRHPERAPIVVQQFCGVLYCGFAPVSVAKRHHQDGGVERTKRNRIVTGALKRQHPPLPRSRTRSRDATPVSPKISAPLAGLLALDSPVKARGDLVEAALRYLGTNPTGWGSVWCGRFMALIAPEAARLVKNPNWARDWAADLPKAARRVGAIVILSRGRGGHIGVVAGFGSRGPIVISGNTGARHRGGRVVGIGEFDERRVLAYVRPSLPQHANNN